MPELPQHHQEDVEGESSTTCAVQQTIEVMESSQLCLHPVHKHSFSQVTFLISGFGKTCAGCGRRLNSVFAANQDTATNKQVVRCRACYAYAHRTCALESPSCPPENSVWKEKHCPVNSTIIQKDDASAVAAATINESEGIKETPVLIAKEEDRSDDPIVNSDNIQKKEAVMPLESMSAKLTSVDSDKQVQPSESMIHSFSSSTTRPLMPSETNRVETPQVLTEADDEVMMVWTPDGPPRHWASRQSLEGLKPVRAEEQDGQPEVVPIEEDEPLHYANHPFASVSRTLQENIIAFFQESTTTTTAKEELTEDPKETSESTQATDDNTDGEMEFLIPHESKNVDETTVRKTEETDYSSSQEEEDVMGLLTEVKPPVPPESSSSVVRLASDTYAAVKTSAQTRKKIGFASVAGGIAGGAAGLLMAGPAGAVIGAKCGQAAGALGVILEGSVSVGFVVAGVAAASLGAQQLNKREEKRILTIGEDVTQRKVLLVRRNVTVDPVWEEITATAIRTAPANSRLTFGILPSSVAKQAEFAKRERNRRDSDIVETAEDEIPTEDKVLLLVSRSLNDKLSLPGHVFRCLIQEHRERCKQWQIEIEDEKELVDGRNHENAAASEQAVETDVEPRESPVSSRERRRDTHAVIKHVTATLLEVRPGFAVSPKITEMSATAVEGLVFGELYDLVFKEIVDETEAADEQLMNKILAFERDQSSDSTEDEQEDRGALRLGDGVSQPALDALHMLPREHNAVGKLRCCVEFLELISKHFSLSGRDNNQRKTNAINADSLLKMVCQHVIVAKIDHINAEIAFLEEYARDEQLLRGKEGYALVTMQASLHFLNASADFERDIFQQDEEEENIPMVSTD